MTENPHGRDDPQRRDDWDDGFSEGWREALDKAVFAVYEAWKFDRSANRETINLRDEHIAAIRALVDRAR